jgi:hypothetical protein
MSPPPTSPLACDSRILRVVVHARGAVVTRAVTLPAALPPEACEILVPGISALAEPASFRALAEGSREVVSVQARVVLPEGAASPGPARTRIRELEQERVRLEEKRNLLRSRRDLLGGISLDTGLARRFRPSDPRGRVEDALAVLGLVGRELADLDARIRELDADLEQNARALNAARLDAEQATAEQREGASRPSFACVVRLAAGEGALAGLQLEYVTAAARWWPTYKAWLGKGATTVRWEIDALVAQASGEDWKDVAIALSTADLITDARLPELKSLRFGRAQPPAKRGYRPPPAGLDALFESFDSSMARIAPAPPPPAARPAAPPPAQAPPPPPPPPSPALFQAQSGSFGAPPGFGPPGAAPLGGMPMPAAAAPAPAFAPQAPRAKKRASMAERSMGTRGGGGGFFDEVPEELGSLEPAAPPPPPPPLEPDDDWLEFDSLVLAGAGERERRGRLVRQRNDRARREAEDARRRIEGLSDPARTSDPLGNRGRFDHRYDAEGRADVPSNALPHRVHIGSAEGPATPRFRTVPRESPEVFREARLENPHKGPLLAGPVDVFLDGALVTSTTIGAVDRGGFIQLGLGVEDRLRVARNARVEEGSAGLLGGSTQMDHQITVDLASSLGMPVAVEVLERIPVTDDKDIQVKVIAAEPEPDAYDQADLGVPVRGGRRFRVEVPAGGKARASYTYRIKLPAKSEIVGGNRRD